MDARLYLGGTKAPYCTQNQVSRVFETPNMRRVAAEYATGEFTLGMYFSPSTIDYQADEINASEVEVGEDLLLLAIPAQHILKGVFIEVVEADAAFAGATLSFQAHEFDLGSKKLSSKLSAIPGVNDVSLAGLSDQYVHIPAPYYVPKGKSLMLALRYATAATDPTKRLRDTKAKIRIVAKVGGFDSPIHY